MNVVTATIVLKGDVQWLMDITYPMTQRLQRNQAIRILFRFRGNNLRVIQNK